MNTKIAFVLLAAILLAGCETDVQQQRRLQHEQHIRLEQARIQAEAQVRIANHDSNRRAETARFRASLMHQLLIVLTVATAVGGTIWGFILLHGFVFRERCKALIALSEHMTDEQRQAAIAGLLAGTGADGRALLLEHKR